MNNNASGIALFWNDQDLIVEEYTRKTKHYFCGRELLKFPEGKILVWQILIIDYSECCFAQVYSDTEIVVKFSLDANIKGKSKPGGQSQARYAHNRENEIDYYFKQINEFLKVIDGEVIIGMSSIYYNRFYDTLSTYNKAKIKARLSIENSGLTGVYEMLNLLNSPARI